ncbi:Uma2 family endonuclease [Streptomyces sp. NBC_01351]|uniref:Uma2 family endonuclease n=1 Tax=Streptomyces sp. NBC_01351 TaxID=2903833 RepID=UPI002E36A750|nr:Uma2 family endonuclease [Streptomyces sp. NBC_01351]
MTTSDSQPPGIPPVDPELADALRRAWQAIDPPETFRVEVVEEFIEIWRVGPFRHSLVANRLRSRLTTFLDDGPYSAYQVLYVKHGHRAWAPDVLVAPDDLAGHVSPDGYGIEASAVALMVEVVAPEPEGVTRDRSRKRRAYARAGIPVYVIIDDYDGHGTVSVLTGPVPGEAQYASEVRMPYGTEVVVPEGPAKGFAIGEDITGALRSDG